jgi:hypothetical protein
MAVREARLWIARYSTERLETTVTKRQASGQYETAWFSIKNWLLCSRVKPWRKKCNLPARVGSVFIRIHRKNGCTKGGLISSWSRELSEKAHLRLDASSHTMDGRQHSWTKRLPTDESDEFGTVCACVGTNDDEFPNLVRLTNFPTMRKIMLLACPQKQY